MKQDVNLDKSGKMIFGDLRNIFLETKNESKYYY